MILTQRLAEWSQWKLQCWGILGGFGKTPGGFVLSYSSFFLAALGWMSSGSHLCPEF